MTHYAVTYKGKLITNRELYNKHWGYYPKYHTESYMIGKSELECAAQYNFSIDSVNGWADKMKDVDIQKIGVIE